MRALLILTTLASACGTTEPPPPADAGPDTVDVAIVPTDEGAPSIFDDIDDDVPVPWDLPEVDLIEADPDVPLDVPGAFSSCPTLGVSPHWSGTFKGIVTYAMPNADIEPKEGLFMVEGELAFDITCIEQKLLVIGTLTGEAEAAGNAGKHPFAAKIYGEYSNITRTVEAKLVDGEVRLFKVISVFFEGDFNGTVKQNGTFDGTWDAVETSNDLGIDGDASGYGTWMALGTQ